MLAVNGLKIVLPIALRFAEAHRGSGLTLQDFIQAGAIGAIQSATNFNPTKYKGKFNIFATPRIKGAMWDELREFGVG